MEITNHKHPKFVLEMATHGNKIIAYKKAYPKVSNDHVAAVNAARLLKNAAVMAAIEEKSSQIQQIATVNAAQQVSKELTGKVLSFVEKREILAQIAAGAYPLKRKVPGKNGRMKTITVYPNHTNIKDAIELDNKMTGDFAADKRDINLNQGKQTTGKLTDKQFFELLNKINTNGKNSSDNGASIQSAGA